MKDTIDDYIHETLLNAYAYLLAWPKACMEDSASTHQSTFIGRLFFILRPEESRCMVQLS